jgi:Caspase domain
MAADDYAIVVGIRHYPQLTSLRGPVADAEAFCDWVTSADGGAVPTEQAKLIVSPAEKPPDPITAPPTLMSVMAELDRLQDLGYGRGGRAGRRLWLYLAGHGVAPTAGDAALVMANANLQRLYHLPAAPYLNWFRTAAMFDEVAVIADCCREHFGRLPPFSLPWTDDAKAGADVHYFTAFATKWSRLAREKPVNGSGQVRGLFTLALLEGLKHGGGTAASVEKFVGQRLPELSAPTEFQEPVFDYDVDLQLAATIPPKPCTLTVTFAADDPAVTVTVVDGALATVAAFPMTDGSRHVPLDPGLYGVRRSDQPDAGQALIRVTTEHEHVTV